MLKTLISKFKNLNKGIKITLAALGLSAIVASASADSIDAFKHNLNLVKVNNDILIEYDLKHYDDDPSINEIFKISADGGFSYAGFKEKMPGFAADSYAEIYFENGKSGKNVFAFPNSGVLFKYTHKFKVKIGKLDAAFSSKIGFHNSLAYGGPAITGFDFPIGLEALVSHTTGDEKSNFFKTAIGGDVAVAISSKNSDYDYSLGFIGLEGRYSINNSLSIGFRHKSIIEHFSENRYFFLNSIFSNFPQIYATIAPNGEFKTTVYGGFDYINSDENRARRMTTGIKNEIFNSFSADFLFMRNFADNVNTMLISFSHQYGDFRYELFFSRDFENTAKSANNVYGIRLFFKFDNAVNSIDLIKPIHNKASGLEGKIYSNPPEKQRATDEVIADFDTIRTILEWTAKNVHYDYNSSTNLSNELSKLVEDREGVCGDQSRGLSHWFNRYGYDAYIFGFNNSPPRTAGHEFLVFPRNGYWYIYEYGCLLRANTDKDRKMDDELAREIMNQHLNFSKTYHDSYQPLDEKGKKDFYVFKNRIYAVTDGTINWTESYDRLPIAESGLCLTGAGRMFRMQINEK